MSRLRVESRQPRRQFTPPFGATRFLRKFNTGNTAKEVVDITGLPGYWIHQNQERLRLGIPFYRIANGDVIRFSIEELFLWEMHHLRPCRYPAKGNADAP